MLEGLKHPIRIQIIGDPWNTNEEKEKQAKKSLAYL